MKPSALARRITLEQRTQMVHDAQSLIDQYRAEMEASFWPKRRQYEREANDDFSHRLSADPNNQRIYDLSNESLNIVRNVTRFMKARCGEDVFGSAPWFTVTPVGTQDNALAGQINKHAPWKLDQAQYSKHGKEGIGLALDLGEVVLKTTHRTTVDIHDKLELVLVDKRTGKEVLAPKFDEAGAPVIGEDGEQEGDYIYPEDEVLEVEEAPPPSFPKAGNATPATGKTAFAAPKVRQFYAKDGRPTSIAVSAATEFREKLIEKREVTYHGADVAATRFDDFIAPLNVASLDLAPAVGHVFERSVSQLRAKYFDESDEDSRVLFAMLESEPEGPKTQDTKPRETMGEAAAGRQRMHRNPNVKVTEIYLRDYDVFGDGIGRNVFLVLAADHDIPLYIEYLANVTPKGLLPFHAVAVNRVPGRWYGRGFYELYQNSQRLIDALINAILHRNENSADPVTFWQPDATEEGHSEKRFIRHPGKTYTLRAGKTAKDACQVLEFPDLDDRTWELVQLIMQLIQTDSGVTSAAQGDYSALPSASTATGVSSILQSASTLHRMLTEDLKDGFKPAVLFALLLIYARQDKDETFQYLEGGAAEVLTLSNARLLAQLEMNVTILLTRFHMREQRESAQLIITNVLPQWVATLQASGLPTVDIAANAQKLFVQVAKGADIQGAEQIFALPQVVPLPVADPNAPQAPAGEAAPAQEPAPVVPDNVIPSPTEQEATTAAA